MELFEMVFKPETIYNTLFIDIKVIAEYPTSGDFAEQNPDMHSKWIDIANSKYGHHDNRMYHMKAVNFPEFSKISNITIGVVGDDNGSLKRTIEVIKGENEKELISNFYTILSQMENSEKGKKYLCGHVISGHHIPFLIKRGLKNDLMIPQTFKKTLMSKPWDGNLIDTSLIWKFNSIGFNSIDMISDFLDLKINIDLRKSETISEYYYNSKDGDVRWLEDQSRNEVNLLIQILKRMREV